MEKEGIICRKPPMSAIVTVAPHCLPSRTENYIMTASTNAAPTSGLIDRFFQVSARGSTVGTEIRAGVVTFFAMAYIIILNPLIIGTVEDHTGTALGVPQVAP